MPKKSDHARVDVGTTDGARRAVDVAYACLHEQLDTLGVRLDAAVEHGAPRDIHKLRVATRRADAALDVFADFIPKKRRRKLRRRLRAIRRAAAPARQADVHAKAIATCGWDEATLEHARASLDAERRMSLDDVREFARPRTQRRLDRRVRRVLEAVGDAKSKPVFARHAAATEKRLMRAAERAGHRDLADIENLHALRLRLKRVRYGLEVLAPALDPSAVERRLSSLKKAQDQLGAINDAEELATRCRQLAEDASPAVAETLLAHAGRLADEVRDAHGRFVETWTNTFAADEELLET